MEAALNWLFSHPLIDGISYRPRLVLLAGFSGALQQSIGVGAVILASEIADLEGHCWPATWPGQRVWEAGPAIVSHRGRILGAPRLVGDPVMKRQLGEKFAALAIDMESEALAQFCTARAVPFGCVRVVSDDVDTPLSPRLITLLSGGRVSAWRIFAAVLASPGLGNDLWRLAKQTRLAAKRLGGVLEMLLPLCFSQQPANA
jgi:hypothetical protein